MYNIEKNRMTVADNIRAGSTLASISERLGYKLEPNGCLILPDEPIYADDGISGKRQCELFDGDGPPSGKEVAIAYADAIYRDEDDDRPEIVVFRYAISPTGAIVRVELSRHKLTCECGCGCTERGISRKPYNRGYICRMCRVHVPYDLW